MIIEKKYEIKLINSYDKVNFFMNYLNEFYENNKLKKNKYVSIDFEYTKNKIQLWQICFYNKNNTIFVIQEKYISEDNLKIIIKQLYLSKIIKIFHGAESLDFPYVFSLLKKPKLIYKFLKSTFDTRFLCEYLKINNQNKLCNVYDAMLSFGALTKEKYDELQKMNKAMGDIWKVNWNNIDKDDKLLTYTIYDVIYLKNLLINIYNKFKDNNVINEFYELQKVNIYVLLKRYKIDYDYNLKIENVEKYKIIDYYRKIL